MKFGSVCSGIEAASVAWEPLGWKAVWLSEIEPFPSAVLKHHYPDVPNLGDMTTLPERIASGEVEAPDVFCGGTPCQAFSVAGLRKSLDDSRGNLSLTFCEIADAIDDIRRGCGDDHAIIFWENVPGVLSTKDNAFGCFLAGLAGENQPLIPAGKKWTNSGVVLGPKRAVAWRVLDAQYFGLAQRRRRVFVVASARDGFDPAAVLFEFDGVRRDFAPSREAGQAVAPTISGGPPFSRTGNERVEADAVFVQPYTVANCLTQRMHKGINTTLDEGQTPVLVSQPVTYDFFNITAPVNRQSREPGDPCHTLARSNAEHAVVMQPITIHPTQDPISSENVCHSIGANANATAAVMQAIPVDTMNHVGRGDSHSFGDFEPGAPSYTLTKGHSYAVAVPPTMQVRRLTPVECARLQGFPDDYLTRVPWRGKPTPPDGPMYKALGNSWAVPVVRWIGQRIQNAINSKNENNHTPMATI